MLEGGNSRMVGSTDSQPLASKDIPSQLNLLKTIVNNIEGEMGALQKQLAPILVIQIREGSDNKALNERVDMSPLAMEMEVIRNCLENIAGQIHVIQASIQL